MSNPYFHIHHRRTRPTDEQVKSCRICGKAAVCYVGITGYCKAHRGIAVNRLVVANAATDHLRSKDESAAMWGKHQIISRERLRQCKKRHK